MRTLDSVKTSWEQLLFDPIPAGRKRYASTLASTPLLITEEGSKCQNANNDE